MNSFNSKILNGNILFHSHYIRKHKAFEKVLNLYLLKSDLKPIVPFKKKVYKTKPGLLCVLMLNDTSANYQKKKKKKECMYINFNQFTFTVVKLIQRLLFFY